MPAESPISSGVGAPDAQFQAELRGLDALELGGRARRGGWVRAVWDGAWPKVTALAVGLLAWQAIVWSGWRPEYILAGPSTVFPELASMASDGSLGSAVATTMRRAVFGYAIATVIGVVIGALVTGSRHLRVAVGSFITGLQTMPSIAWFPLAILLFQLTESAITFVVVLGAAPSIANGLIAGVDQIPPLWLRAGRVLGARGYQRWRHIVLPGAMPGFLAGAKQGWAFAWRSLLAGELIVILANRPSLGSVLQFSRELSDAARLEATMVVILTIGLVMDEVVFGTLDRRLRRGRGLIG